MATPALRFKFTISAHNLPFGMSLLCRADATVSRSLPRIAHHDDGDEDARNPNPVERGVSSQHKAGVIVGPLKQASSALICSSQLVVRFASCARGCHRGRQGIVYTSSPPLPDGHYVVSSRPEQRSVYAPWSARTKDVRVGERARRFHVLVRRGRVTGGMETSLPLLLSCAP